MITYIQKTLWKGVCLSDKDKVFAAIAVPRGGVFHGCNFDLHLRQIEHAIADVVMYGITAYSVPLHDVDAGDSFQSIWDKLVPKGVAQGASALDLDTVASDTTPEYEPGLVNWAGVYDMESGPKRLYRKRTMISASNAGVGPAATGTMTHYLPTDRVNINVSGGFRAKVPSVVMFALSSPVLDETVTGSLSPPANDKEWVMLQYLEDTAIDALKFLIGLTVSGTQEPYEEAAIFLDKTLAPDPVEETAAAAEFATGTWEMTVKGSWTMSVPGTMSVKTLDGDK